MNGTPVVARSLLRVGPPLIRLPNPAPEKIPRYRCPERGLPKFSLQQRPGPPARHTVHTVSQCNTCQKQNGNKSSIVDVGRPVDKTPQGRAARRHTTAVDPERGTTKVVSTIPDFYTRQKPPPNTVSCSPSCSTQRRAQPPKGTEVDTTSDGTIAETTHRKRAR